MSTPGRLSLVHRFVDPMTSLGEILFGLIMTLTFTLGAGLVIGAEGREGVRELLFAVVGCNVAWGIIDGALHLVSQIFDRGRLRRLGWSIRNAPTAAAATELVATEFDEPLGYITSDEDREWLYRRIVDNVRARSAPPNTVTKADLAGAMTSCVLVIATCVPAAIPFLLIDDPHVALRASNAILLALLFVTGFVWARYTLGNPWIVGFGFLIGGVTLVAVAIALGG